MKSKNIQMPGIYSEPDTAPCRLTAVCMQKVPLSFSGKLQEETRSTDQFPASLKALGNAHASFPSAEFSHLVKIGTPPIFRPIFHFV